MLSTESNTIPPFPPDIRAKIDKLHCLYGRDKNLGDILDGINMRLARARRPYGPGASVPLIVKGLYNQLDELRKLCRPKSIEEILAGLIDRKKRFNRLVELQSKALVSDEEKQEIKHLRRMFTRYLYQLARGKRTHGLWP
jgi:hypothetical protein